MLLGKHKGWLHVLAFIFPYLIVVGLFQFAGFYVAGVDIADAQQPKSSLETLIIKAFDLMGTMLLLWLFMKFADRLNFIKLGFETRGRGKDVVLGIGLGLVIMLLAYLLLLIAGQIRFLKLDFKVMDVLISTGLFLLVAVVEEVVYRGYILRNFMISFNRYVALILSSALFALVHSFNPNVDWFALFNIFLAGILLGMSYIHTKNLWFPIALHLSWNLFQSYFGFNVSGIDFYSIIEFSIPQPNLWNGGAFGFESSLLSIFFQILAITGIFWYFKPNKTGNND